MQQDIGGKSMGGSRQTMKGKKSMPFRPFDDRKREVKIDDVVGAFCVMS
jgi:hypothetical protein